MSGIRAVKVLSAAAKINPASGHAAVEVQLSDGSASSFVAATPDQPARWMKSNKKDFSFDKPVLFVSRLDEETIREAVSAMAEDMSGYWLRYYNSTAKREKAAR